MKNPATEQVRLAIQQGKESELTKEAVLQSLREHEIQSLDAFVERGLHAVQQSKPRPLAALFPAVADRDPLEQTIDLLFGSNARSRDQKLVHKEPKLPFIVGDACYAPAEIHRFDGKLLRFVWDTDAIADGFLKAVRDGDEMREFLAQPRENALREHHVPGRGHTFYEHINYGGAVLSLDYRHAYPDLTGVTMRGWWFWATSWNDQISSLRTGSGEVTLAEHVMNPYLHGATMTVPRFTSIAWIGGAWNDRVSAILG